MTTNATRFLDQAQTLAQLQTLETGAGHVAELLAQELAAPAATLADIEQRDAVLGAALSHIDATLTRAMRVRLDHALAMDTAIAQPTRNVFAQTIVAYADRLPLLAQRARDVATRGGAHDPDAIARAVVDAAVAVFALRHALRGPVLVLVAELATQAIAEADARARDTKRDDVQRKRWSAMRRELEALAADPARIATAPLATRLASHPEQVDEPAREPERSFADLIELD